MKTSESLKRNVRPRAPKLPMRSHIRHAACHRWRVPLRSIPATCLRQVRCVRWSHGGHGLCHLSSLDQARHLHVHPRDRIERRHPLGVLAIARRLRRSDIRGRRAAGTSEEERTTKRRRDATATTSRSRWHSGQRQYVAAVAAAAFRPWRCGLAEVGDRAPARSIAGCTDPLGRRCTSAHSSTRAPLAGVTAAAA